MKWNAFHRENPQERSIESQAARKLSLCNAPWNSLEQAAHTQNHNGWLAMNADAERHRARAAIYIQIAKLMTNETSTDALRAKAEDHISKAKAIEERERQIPQAPSNCGSRRTIKHIRVASGLVRASAVKSGIQRVKDPDAERASIFDQAKAEALEKAKAAVAELNALGLNYTLSTGAGRQG